MNAPAKQPWSFSLRQLFVATFAVAVLIFFFQTVPEAVLQLATLAAVALFLWGTVKAGMAAVRKNRHVPFAECIGAWFCTIFCVVPAPRFWNEAVVVWVSVAMCFGLMLAISSIRQGLWSTRLLALPPLVVHLFLLQLIVASVLSGSFALDWDYAVKYWLENDSSILNW